MEIYGQRRKSEDSKEIKTPSLVLYLVIKQTKFKTEHHIYKSVFEVRELP